ncbi:hypothetical protein LY78DRAFT_660615 [Colletotrichum sublineola]|nr:hypothetical protein LY78DRAFT_660615 [Colletotrichum sublineola]
MLEKQARSIGQSQACGRVKFTHFFVGSAWLAVSVAGLMSHPAPHCETLTEALDKRGGRGEEK